MAQHDYDIANQGFPAFRSDLNNVLEAINTSNSGTSRPSSAVAGTVWLDTTSATTPTLKFYDGADDISLATLDYTANTVNWLDSSVVSDLVNDTTPQLGGQLDVNGNAIGDGTLELLKFVETGSAVNELTITNNSTTNAPILSSTGDDTNIDLAITPKGSGNVVLDGIKFPNADGTADQILKTDGSGNLSFADASAGGTSWQTVKTGAFTAVAGEGYFCNTTSSAFTATLPASASQGDEVSFIDYAGTFDTNNLTVGRNSHNIQGDASDSSISFTTGIDSTYKEYMFIFNNIHPETDGTNFQFNLSTDSGSNYNVTKTTTYFYSSHKEDGTSGSMSYYANQDLAQGTGFQNLLTGTGTDNDQSGAGYLHLFNPSSTTFVKHFIARCQHYMYVDFSQEYYTAGYGNTTSAVDAVQFKMSSGNIDDGTIQMFGVV